MARQRVRIRFAKQGDLRLISHRDLLRTWERLFRRAKVTLAMTEGFHPKPKMMFPSALAVGIEGCDEVLEIELPEAQEAAAHGAAAHGAAPHEPERLAAAIRSQAPPGLVIHGVEALESGPKTQLRGMTFMVDVPAERRVRVAEQIERLLAQSSYLVTRAGRATPIDLRPLIDELVLDDDGALSMRLCVEGDGSARPREVLEALGLAEVEAFGIVLRRTAVELST